MVHPSTLPPMVRGEPFPMTWEEFLEWSPDEGQSEWVDGEGIAYVSNSARHVVLVRFLGGLIGRFAQVFNLGEVFSESLLMRLMTRPSGRMPDVFVSGRAERLAPVNIGMKARPSSSSRLSPKRASSATRSRNALSMSTPASPST